MHDRKPTNRTLLGLSALLLVGVGIGARFAPASEVIVQHDKVEVPVVKKVPGKTVLVHDPYLPEACADAIKLGDRYARLADAATDHAPALLDAIGQARLAFAGGDPENLTLAEDKIRRIDSRITNQIISIQSIKSSYDRATTACRETAE